MATKYEHELQMQEERKKRIKNIERLQALLTEVREIRAAVPQDHSNLEAIRDRDFLTRRMRWLEDLLKDEQRAYDATFQAPAGDAKYFTTLV